MNHIAIDAAFDSGNIEVLAIDGASARLAIHYRDIMVGLGQIPGTTDTNDTGAEDQDVQQLLLIANDTHNVSHTAQSAHQCGQMQAI